MLSSSHVAALALADPSSEIVNEELGHLAEQDSPSWLIFNVMAPISKKQDIYGFTGVQQAILQQESVVYVD